MEIAIGEVVASPGEKSKGWLRVSELSNGLPVNVPVMVVNGTKPGPKLWVEATIHGDEVGAYAIANFWEELDPKTLSGVFIGIPVVNTTGFEAGQRISPYDNKDLNRNMPGDPNGTLIERVAYKIFQEILANADYVIDIHWTKVPGHVLFPGVGGEVEERSKEFAMSFGHELVVGDRGEGLLLGNSVINQAALKGIPSMIVELNDHNKMKQGFLNTMIYLKMIKGKPKPLGFKPTQTVFQGWLWHKINMRRGGLFVPKVKLAEDVSKGQVVGEIVNLFGEKLDELISPVKGVVISFGLRMPPIPVRPGSHPVQIAYYEKGR